MNFEKGLIDLFEGVSTINFNVIGKGLLVAIIVFWAFVIFWAFVDARERYEHMFVAVVVAFAVGIFNIFGLIIYLIIRPHTTLEETKWAELEQRYLHYETQDLRNCPVCDFMLQPGFVVCPNCGYRLKVKCIKCGTYIDKDWNICPFCEQKQHDKSVIVKKEPSQKLQAKSVSKSTEPKLKSKSLFSSFKGFVRQFLSKKKRKSVSSPDKSKNLDKQDKVKEVEQKTSNVEKSKSSQKGHNKYAKVYSK